MQLNMPSARLMSLILSQIVYVRIFYFVHACYINSTRENVHAWSLIQFRFHLRNLNDAPIVCWLLVVWIDDGVVVAVNAALRER